LPACSTIAGIVWASGFVALADDDIELELKSRFWTNFLTLKFLTVQDREIWLSCCFDVDRAVWSGWPTELAPFESDICSKGEV
jgi:hypothetical protein